MFKKLPLTVLAFSFLGLIVVNAQVVVDAGGPRNSFFGNDSGKTLGLQGLNIKLDTASESVEGIYFHRFFSDALLSGMDLKLAPVNGLNNINAWPQTDLSVLLNYSGNWDFGTASRCFWTVTLRDTPSFAQDPIFDISRPANREFYTKDAWGNTLPLTFSMVPGGPVPWLSYAVSVAYSWTNNYSSLKKVTVGKAVLAGGSLNVGSGQAARYGSFKNYNAFPITLMTPINFDAIDAVWAKDFNKWFDGATSSFFKLFGSGESKATHVLILSPYGGYIPNDLGKPSDSVGLNLVIRGLSISDELHPEKDKLSMPLSIFVERDNAFLGKPSMSVGAALIFKWP